jgi:hypothetical protein
LAIGGALIGAFSRYIKNIYRFISLIFILLLCVFIVKILQWSGNEESNLKLLFIWIGLIDFLILNVIVGWEFLSNGFVPAMDRKNEKIPSPDIATEINEG